MSVRTTALPNGHGQVPNGRYMQRPRRTSVFDEGLNTIQPCRLRLHHRAPDLDTLTLTLTSTLTPDLAGYPRIIINVGSSTIVPLAPSPSCCADTAPAAHSISPSGGKKPGSRWAPPQVLRHLTVASGSRQTTALPAVALSCVRMGELLISWVKLGIEVCSVRQPRQPHVIPQIEAQARMDA